MTAEPIALIPQCAECRTVWLPRDQGRWSADLTDDDPPEIVFYCPQCSEREFGEAHKK